jgi:hypothetical protein
MPPPSKAALGGCAVRLAAMHDEGMAGIGKAAWVWIRGLKQA